MLAKLNDNIAALVLDIYADRSIGRLNTYPRSTRPTPAEARAGGDGDGRIQTLTSD